MVNVRQFRNWLQIDQPADNLSYYGRCSGGQVELDVYSGNQFLGYEDGSLSSLSGFWGAPSTSPWTPRQQGVRMRASWNSFANGYAAGRETWYRW